jgi:hypothetical protein
MATGTFALTPDILTNGGFALGSDRFQRQIASMVGRRTWPGKSGRPKKCAPDSTPLNLPI